MPYIAEVSGRRYCVAFLLASAVAVACTSGGDSLGDETSVGLVVEDDFVEENVLPEDIEYCDPVRDWDADWSRQERELLVLINDQRAVGADCGTEGSFDAAGPLEMDPHLRCSARRHTLDIVEREFFSHNNPDGENPFARMRAAGYEGNHMAENIAAGKFEPEETLRQWMGSDPHCSAIMEGNFREIGIGYRPGGEWVYNWTANFGSPHAPPS